MSDDISRQGRPVLFGIVAFLTLVSLFATNSNKVRTPFDVLTVRTGFTPNGVLFADINGDGNPDLVTVSAKDHVVSVLIGSGDGVFGPAVSYDFSGRAPLGVAICRLRGSAQDVVTVNLSTGDISVLFNSGGRLEPPVNIPTSPGPTAVACGDLNGDGRDDLVVTSLGANSVDVFLNKGNGSFGPKLSLPTKGQSPRALAIADLNRDGKNDLIVANSGSNNLSILLNEGGATFKPAQTVPVPATPSSVVAADFDGDGQIDLATANTESDSISVFLNRGNGGFAHFQDFNASRPSMIAAADLNRDGKADLIFPETTAKAVGVLLSTPAKPLAEASHLPTKGEHVLFAAVGDINRDGKLDIVAANPGSNSLSLLLQDVTAPRIDSLRPEPTTTVSLSRGQLDKQIVATFNTALDASTINADSVLVSGSQSGFHKCSAQYNPNDLTVQLAPADSTNFDPGEIVSVMFTDKLRSDKRLPLAQPYTYAFNVRPVAGDGSFVETQRISCDKIPGKLRAADLDNDGKVDIVSLCREVDGLRVMFNRGTADFEQGLLLKTNGYGPWDLILADFNRDNKIDIAVVNTFSNNMAVFYNQGNRKFSPPVMFPAGAGPMGICTGDFNGDGYLDIAVVTKGFPAVLVFLNDRKGGFLKPTTYTVAPSPYDISSRDVNGDGAPDLVMTNLESDRGTILINDGDGSFRKPQEFPLLLAKALTQEPIDVNGDGKTDIVALNTASDDLSVFLNQGADKFKQMKNIAIGPTPTDKVFGDFNHDGLVDIAVTLDGGEVAIMLNNGNGSFTKSQVIKVGKNPTSPVAADFDGDGTIDLAIANRYSFDISILLNSKHATPRQPAPHKHTEGE